MPSDKGSLTAAELLSRLEADPEWVKERDDRARARRERIEDNQRDAEPLIEALAGVGLHVALVADLYNRGLTYQKAIPVLIDWLPRIDNPAVKESIVQALTVEWARQAAARALVDESRRADNPSNTGLRWAIGNALSEVADDSVFDGVVELAEDRRWDKARQMVAVAANHARFSRRRCPASLAR